MPWKIAGQIFDTVDRSLIEAEPVDHEITRTGGDGTAFQVDAYRAPTQELTTTTALDGPAAGELRSICKAMETTTVTVVDQHGWEWKVYVRKVRITWSQRIDGKYLLRATWALVPRSERPW